MRMRGLACSTRSELVHAGMTDEVGLCVICGHVDEDINERAEDMTFVNSLGF